MKIQEAEVKLTEQDHLLFGAIWHFLFWINVDELFGPDGVDWDDHMKKHFREKLTGYISRGELNHCDIASIVKWIQEMNRHYQEPLLEYIVKHHWNKW